MTDLTLAEERWCPGHCGSLSWTLDAYGSLTHKHSCPRRTEARCQSHPNGCPADSASPAEEPSARPLYDLLAARHETRPIVEDTGGGVPGDRYPLDYASPAEERPLTDVVDRCRQHTAGLGADLLTIKTREATSTQRDAAADRAYAHLRGIDDILTAALASVDERLDVDFNRILANGSVTPVRRLVAVDGDEEVDVTALVVDWSTQRPARR